MSVFDKIKSIFKKSPDSSVDATVVDAVEVVNEDSTVEFVPLSISSQTTQQNNEPDWLINEDILRDEGVIFGLSGSNPEEKVSIIRHYFAQQTAETDRVIEQKEEQIGELNYWVNEKESLVKELEIKIQDLKNQEFTEQHHLPRTIVGLLLACGIAIKK